MPRFQPFEPADCFGQFVDGSCMMPYFPQWRLATWAVTVARHGPADAPFILKAGLLPGLLQTSMFGLLSACRFCRVTGARVKVWCDCLGVVRKCKKMIAGAWWPKHNTKNSDLWHLLCEEIAGLDGRVDVQKVSAHVSLDEADDTLLEWLVINNDDVDSAARQAQALRGQPFWELWREVQRDLALHQMVGKTVMDVHVIIGQTASRRPERPVAGTPGFWKPSEQSRLVLGAVPICSH